MHTKTLFTTLLASQLAFAAVIPMTERRVGLNPISGLPTPNGGQHKHKHGHKHLAAGGINPISGLPAPRVKLHGREAEAEAAQQQGHRHNPTAGNINPVNGMPAPGDPVYSHGRHGQGQGHKNGNGHRHNPTAGNVNPINGMAAPGDPAYRHSRQGQGQGHRNPTAGNINPINGMPAPGDSSYKHPNGNRPHNGQGSQSQAHPNRPHNNDNNGQAHPNSPHNGQGNPKGVPIPTTTHLLPLPPHIPHNPLHTTKPQGIVIVPMTSSAPKPTPPPAAPHKDNSEGVIGKRPSRRGVEVPEADGEYADEKSAQVSEFDEGLATTEDEHFDGDFSSEGVDEEERQLFERDMQTDAEFMQSFEVDGMWWQEHLKSGELELEES